MGRLSALSRQGRNQRAKKGGEENGVFGPLVEQSFLEIEMDIPKEKLARTIKELIKAVNRLVSLRDGKSLRAGTLKMPLRELSHIEERLKKRGSRTLSYETLKAMGREVIKIADGVFKFLVSYLFLCLAGLFRGQSEIE
ncbi:MAG: hypothetical protein HY562_03995 [Ignavibacteriales bacterium]|nr:hypothetical protein [Ignavibacteriales bacterium]